MFTYFINQVLIYIGIFFRTIRAFFLRQAADIARKLKRLANFSRQARKAASASLQSAAAMAKAPTSRNDYLETGRLYISKRLLISIITGIIMFVIIAWFVIWPFILSRFLTARFFVEDARVPTWTGHVIVYSDAEKTIPLYEGKLEEGVLQGKGKQYDENGVLTYEGAFSSGAREGKGISYENGSMIYEGNFSADVYSGAGKQFESGKLVYEGVFAGGERSGEGIEYYPGGGPKYKGTFLDGVYEGQGIKYNEDGTKLYEGGFARGVYGGDGRLYPSKNQRVEASFADGEPDGAIKWYKSNKLYYDGEAEGLTPSGFGILYRQSGEAMYEGQMANGTIDGAWLLTLSAQEFRDSMGEAEIVEYSDVGGGFVISSPVAGISVLCSYQTADEDPSVMAVYLSQARAEYFELLPGGDRVTLAQWPMPTKSQKRYYKIKGVNVKTGFYDSAAYELDDCRAEVLSTGDKVVLLAWSGKDGGSAFEVAESASSAEAGGGESAADGKKDMESFMESVDGMAETEAASLAAEEQARMDETLAALGIEEDQEGAKNPYCGDTPMKDALKKCATASEASKAIDYMLDYWQASEQRVATENNLKRTEELLKEAQDAVSRGSGNADTAASLTTERDGLNNQLNNLIAEQSKLSMQAKAVGAEDPGKCNVPELGVSFNPASLDVKELALVAAAYSQSSGGTQAAEGDLTLNVKTQLADLAVLYNDLQSALTNYASATGAATEAAKSYAAGRGSKAEWYRAQSAQADSQAAMYAAICAFTKGANKLNDMTGGWVSRTQGWLKDILTPLYAGKQDDAPAQARPEEAAPGADAPAGNG